jgi:hypothetical protein
MHVDPGSDADYESDSELDSEADTDNEETHAKRAKRVQAAAVKA